MGKKIKGRLTQAKFMRLPKAEKTYIKSEAEKYGLIYGTPKQLEKRGWGNSRINQQMTKYKGLYEHRLQPKYLTQFAKNYQTILDSLGANTEEIEKLLNYRNPHARKSLETLASYYKGDALHYYGLFYNEGAINEIFDGSTILTEKVKELYNDIIRAFNINEKDIEEKLGINPDILKDTDYDIWDDLM